MAPTILATLGLITLGTAAYFNYRSSKNKNLLERMSYRDAATFSALLFLASIALKLHGW